MSVPHRLTGYQAKGLVGTLARCLHASTMCLRAGLLAWWLTALVSWTTTAAEVIAGPWVLLAPDGSRLVCVELTRPLDELGLTAAVLADPTAEPAAWGVAEQVPCRRPLLPPTSLLRWWVPAAVSAEFLQVSVADRRLRVRLPSPPAATATRLLVATGNAYPTAADLAAVGEWTGALPELVLLVGQDGLARRLGSGGWEKTVPIAVALRQPRLPPSAAVLLPPAVSWSEQLVWGQVGATVMGPVDEVVPVLAADLSPWRILCDDIGRWHRDRLPVACDAALIDLGDVASRQGVPLIVGPARGSAFLSDPLAVIDGHFAGAPGGPRYLALAGSGTEAVSGSALAARWLPGDACLAIMAEPDRLRLRLLAGGSVLQELAYGRWPARDRLALTTTDPLDLERRLTQWRDRGRLAEQQGRQVVWTNLAQLARWHGRDASLRQVLEQVQSGTFGDQVALQDLISEPYPFPMDGVGAGAGWGVLDIPAAVQAWRTGDQAEAEAAVARLLVAPRPLLAAVLAEELVRERLFARAEEVGGAPLAARLASCFPIAAMRWCRLHEVPVAWQRAAVLAFLEADLPLDDDDFAAVVAALRDPASLRLLANRSHQAEEWRLAAMLRDRLRAQLAGELPWDEDPLLQHRLMSAIFASVYLSPTPLRPVARQARDRLAPLARQVVERFFQRHGEQRGERRVPEDAVGE